MAERRLKIKRGSAAQAAAETLYANEMFLAEDTHVLYVNINGSNVAVGDGTAGPQGNTGSQGPAGSQGNQGSQGSAGSQGNQGFQGFQGNQGFQGGS